MNFGKTILELRKQKNVTQEELAAELGVTAAAVSKWENNYTLPDILMLCALADYFQVTTDELLGRIGNRKVAVISADSAELAAKVKVLLTQHGFIVKGIYPEYQEAFAVSCEDHSITHLFAVFLTEQHNLEFADCRKDVSYYMTSGHTHEDILDGLLEALRK